MSYFIVQVKILGCFFFLTAWPIQTQSILAQYNFANMRIDSLQLFRHSCDVKGGGWGAELIL